MADLDLSEDVLSRFAVEPNHDEATLDRYLAAHPELRSELLGLVLEFDLSETDNSPIDLESPFVQESWARYLKTGSAELANRFAVELDDAEAFARFERLGNGAASG